MNTETMRDDIITNIIQDAGSVDNLVSLQQDWESDSEYQDRIYEEADELFMFAVEDLGLDELSYDAIRDEVVKDIASILMTGYVPY